MGFSACHPAVNLIYFACVMAVTVGVHHPVYLAISVLSAFCYGLKQNGKKEALLAAVLLPCVTLFVLYYGSYHHFGVTVLGQNFIQNSITLEALAYGLTLGFTVAGVLLWLSCIYSIFTADKVVYLFGKVSPRLSLFLTILLRMVPRIRQQARKLNTAQAGIGRAVQQGNLWQRLCHGVRIFSMLISWTIEMLTASSESMRSRGSGLRGRTAYSIYRFDNRDRAYVVALFAAMTLLMMGLLLRQGEASFSPVIRFAPTTAMSAVFYMGYALLCLMPLMLDLHTEYRFRRARRNL